jgi:NAD(P)-dependent dehydrogenase (short-subunit alcohol dehydrogenase family)
MNGMRPMDSKGEDMEIRKRTVFITGAASGIGRATAIRMAREGGRLFLTDINQAGLDETCHLVHQEGGEVCLARDFDITDYQAMRTFADVVHASYGSLDILVNVAGIALFSQIEDMKHADWDKVIRVNLWGPVHGIECFVPEMIRSGRPGHIVTVSSTAGLIGLPWHAAYAASKHALVGISEVLRYDLKKHHIGVSVICPGAVNTSMVQTAEIRAPNLNMAELRKHFLKIAVTPEKVADLIAGAIRKKRFVVITSADIKVLYFFKRVINPLYHLIMQLFTRIADRVLLGKGI